MLQVLKHLPRQQLKRWIPVVVVFVLIAVMSYLWYIVFPTSAWGNTPNYAQMYLEFVATRPLDAFFVVSTGPGEVVSWVFIPTYSLIAIQIFLYILGRKTGHQYVIANQYYLAYLVLLGLFAISFQNASQYYDWYWNPHLGAPGYVDTWTHITSPWLLGAMFAPFALERFFGYDRKFGWFFIFTLLALIAIGWEIAETIDVYYLRPPSSSYFNYPMDSLKDMIMGAGIGTVLSCFIYQKLVIDFLEKP